MFCGLLFVQILLSTVGSSGANDAWGVLLLESISVVIVVSLHCCYCRVFSNNARASHPFRFPSTMSLCQVSLRLDGWSHSFIDDFNDDKEFFRYFFFFVAAPLLVWNSSDEKFSPLAVLFVIDDDRTSSFTDQAAAARTPVEYRRARESTGRDY